MATTPENNAPLDPLRVPLEGTALIEASAGTGKTWAICALALRLLVEKEFSIDQVLILTFTNAATAELRERVRLRLVETLADLEKPATTPLMAIWQAKGLEIPRIRSRIKAALSAFDEAAIFTIHGFCQRALTESPFAAAQAFTLELTDGNELLREVVADYWRLHLTHGALPPVLSSWLMTVKGLQPEQLETLLRRALQKPLVQTCWPTAVQETPMLDPAALEEAYAEVAELWRWQRDEIMARLWEKLPDLNQRSMKEATLQAGAQDWDRYFDNGNPLGALSDKAGKFRASILLELTRKGKTPPQHPFFDRAESLCARRAAQEAGLETLRLTLFRHFLEWAPDQVRRRKRERRQVDFDDLLGNLHRALEGPRGKALAADLRARYPAALIDEFQDTDPLQWAIFQRIYGNAGENAHDNMGGAGQYPPVFLVGDPKQAIYSFRQADLHTYLAAKKSVAAHYRLEANQRSCAGIIQGVNALFSVNPRAFMLDGLEFAPTRRGEKLLSSFIDTSHPARAAFHLWQLPEGLGKAEAQARAARAVAEEIARILSAAQREEVLIDGRALAPERIAILVRTHKQGWLMKEALAAVGLRAAELTQDNVFASLEAEALERFLAALLEPARVSLIKAALSTALLGEDAAAIAALDDDAAALNMWLERFGRWSRCWRKWGVLAALGEASQERQCAARLLELPDGERRLTNHTHLLELLHRAEEEMPQPARLLRWYAARRRESKPDEAALLRLESDQNLVNIVTIHKSKGLEYDLVFCPFLWEGMSTPRQGGLPGQFYHDEMGRLMLDYRPEGEAPGKAAARQEQAAEWLRLYYVALTRPVHRCYLIWGNYEKAVGKSISRTESARSLLNWLVAGASFGPEEWLTAKGEQLPDHEALQKAWRDFVADAQASAEMLPEAGRYRLDMRESARVYRAAVARRRLSADWRIDSFSGLLKKKGEDPGLEAEGRDPDEALALALDTALDVTLDVALDAALDAALPGPISIEAQEATAVAFDDILHFPRGPRAGDCIHDLLEHLDFTQPASWQAAIAGALERHLPSAPAEWEKHRAMLQNLLAHVLATPLSLSAEAPPLCLAVLEAAQRQVELEFHLPVAHLRAQELFDLMKTHDEPLPRLDFPDLRGFLKGYMDMVFVHAGRYYVLDWKSNHLGWVPEDYGHDALRQAMREHGYHLQARLYLLALHRYLKLRLPAYDPAQHLGGACYLFVRGMRPDWRSPDGTQTGISLLAPKVELILEMEQRMTR